MSANLADLHPDRVVGLHLNMVTAAPPVPAPRSPTDEQQALEAAKLWRRTGVGYQEIQGTAADARLRAAGLAGRPGRLDRREVPGVERRRHRRRLHLRPAARQHHRLLGHGHGDVVAPHLLGDAPGPPAAVPERRIEVPTAIAEFPGEISQPPRAWTEAAFDVVRWSTPPKGGHFAAMEAPAEYVDDVRAFFLEDLASA